MRRSSALAVLAALAALCGCSTHRQDLAVSSGMEPASDSTATALTAAARALVDHEAERADGFGTASLVPLTSAAAILAQKTPSAHLLAVTRRLAGLLVQSRVGPGGSFGVSASGRAPRPSAGLTAGAGLALLDAYQATGDVDDVSVAVAAAQAIRNGPLGWQQARSGAGISVGRGRHIDVAQTSEVALLFQRVSALRLPSLASSADLGFHTIFDSQAAVGRWYALRGTREPMSVLQWGETLYALQRSGLREALGITGGGIPALRKEEFDRSGRPRPTAVADPVGVAIACAAIGSYPDLTIGADVFTALLRNRRPDGTILTAGDGDDAAQSEFAQALAQRVAILPASS